MKYTLTVGLEIHAELKTRTKMFCNSKNDPDETRSNVNICPVCMGHPGTLPVINKEAVRNVLRLGMVLGGEITDYTEFDRKNYFYPDIPKGYQISQYKYPLVSGGELLGVKLTRIHLEEDTASSMHVGDSSFLDFNRAGVPLLELVTEPVIHSAEEAANFARELQLVLRYLDLSGANLEKGEMRIEANVSVGEGKKLGRKVEVKNLNSFKSVEKAILFEFERQSTLLDKGETVKQETRGWDEKRGETVSQRAKEESHDYRYFPDPDLPKLLISKVSDFTQEELRQTIPEMPWQKRERYKSVYGLKDSDIEIYILNSELAEYFELVAAKLDESEIVLASNYIISDLKKLIEPESFSEVIRMASSGELSSRGAKDLLKILEEGGDPRKIAFEKNMIQESDKEVLEKIVEEVLSEERDGDLNVNYLVGQAMKKSGGRANPILLQEIVRSKKGEK